jgi:hypothetical protein
MTGRSGHATNGLGSVYMIYHSIIQRKGLAPNDFVDTAELARTLNQFEHHYNQLAKSFEWNFTRNDLIELLQHMEPEATDHVPKAIAA